MSRKSRHSWPEAKKLCRLNQHDIEMAKRLGFRPDALIRAIPSPKQKWKLPVRDWVRCLYQERFGEVLGEGPAAPATVKLEYDEEAARRFGEQLYWEDYWERNADVVTSECPKKKSGRQPSAAADDSWLPEEVGDKDVPF